MDLLKSDEFKILLVIIGFPSKRGSFVSQKILGYLTWLSKKCKCFNALLYLNEINQNIESGSSFHSSDNEKRSRMTKDVFEKIINDMLQWYNQEDGLIGILDGINITCDKRDTIIKISNENDLKIIFMEDLCENETIQNELSKIKKNSEISNNDFDILDEHLDEIDQNDKKNQKKIIDHTYIRLNNCNSKIIVNKIQTHLENNIVQYSMSLSVKPKNVWISRHGESEYNLSGRIGGDSDLSTRGFTYAKQLPGLLLSTMTNGEKDLNIVCWVSTLKRTHQTCSYIKCSNIKVYDCLDEINAGDCDKMTYDEIQRLYPDDFKARNSNKFHFRYKNGESYYDVINRLAPLVIELEKQENVLIITHQAVLRCLFSYFMNISHDKIPWIPIPLHNLIKIHSRALDITIDEWRADIEAVSTQIEKCSFND